MAAVLSGTYLSHTLFCSKNEKLWSSVRYKKFMNKLTLLEMESVVSFFFSIYTYFLLLLHVHLSKFQGETISMEIIIVSRIKMFREICPFNEYDLFSFQ